MTSFIRLSLLLILLLFIQDRIFSQNPRNSLEEPFDKLIKAWFSSIDRGAVKALASLLTDDFELIAFGKRFSKAETIEMSKGYSEVKCQLTNIKTRLGDGLAQISFDVNLKAKVNGKPIEGNAIELYMLERIGSEWKVANKTIMMKEP